MASVDPDLNGYFTDLRDTLRRAVDRVCPSWLASEKDDLVQVSLMRLMSVLRSREGDDLPNSSYVWRTAYSVTVDEIRRRRTVRASSLEDEGPDAVATADGNPHQWVTRRELGEAIRASLQSLGRPRRLAVVMYLQGHSVPEAARLLGWTSKKTENLVYRGLADLRERLRMRGFAP